jgi:spore coat protein CotF
MASIINNIIGNANTQMNDKTIVNDALMASKAAAGAYLTASLESATPELRTLYTSNLQQILQGHASMTDLAIAKDWYKAYDAPDQQLSDAIKHSENTISAFSK